MKTSLEMYDRDLIKIMRYLVIKAKHFSEWFHGTT